jgi:hypothetical protein
MKVDARRSPLLFLIAAVFKQVWRRPFLSTSVVVHAALLAVLYYYGSYQPELREQAAEVASSLRATSVASTAKRLQDLQTIKELLEKSADRVDSQAEPGAAPLATPQTPEEMVEQARELSEQIDAIDKDIQAEELARLTGVPQERAAPDMAAQKPESKANDDQVDSRPKDGAPAAMTPEMAADEVAALEAKARATLEKRQQHLEAKANGVEVERHEARSGSGEQGAGDGSGLPSAHAGGTGEGASPGSASGRGSGPDSSVRAAIAEFIGDQRAEKTPRAKTYDGLNFFDRGSLQIPPVDATSLVRGQGRMLGAGGEFANRVYLNSWYLIGPFAGRHEGGLFDNPSYPPEKAVLLDAAYYGKDQRVLKWRYVTAQSYPLVPPDMVEDSVYYGYTEVAVDQDCDLTAWIGADDDVQVYLNDRLVWRGGNVNKQSYFDLIFNAYTPYLHDYNRTEGTRVLHFKKGRNKIFFKLSNGPNAAFLSMVLTR